jgi:type IV secretion system protein VirD4
MAPPVDALALVRAWSAAAGHGVFLGGSDAPVFASREEGVLVLGPPRSGKTSSVVVPNVLAACGPVVSASTKRDVLDATWRARARVGRCMVFDPGGEVVPPVGVEAIGWSPLTSSRTFDGAVLLVEAMVGAARADTGGESRHWSERAAALLGPLFHAAALEGIPLRQVVSWVDRREESPAVRILAHRDCELAGDVLAGIVRTEEREQSGIWSTASSVLSAYRTEAALASTERAPFDAGAFVSSGGTLFVCATGRRQGHAAPLVAGLIDDIRAAAYAGRPSVPVLLALDELANIAPLRDLPALVSEGGSQGLVTLACLQDLSQARARWGVQADGFLSLFGHKLLMPGIGDVRTLEAVSALCGERDVPVRSTSGGPRWAPLLGGRGPTTTVSTRRERVMPVDALARGVPGMVFGLDARGFGYVALAPFFRRSPWREAAAIAMTRPPQGRGRER